jgi:hypothetical protein
MSDHTIVILPDGCAQIWSEGKKVAEIGPLR